MESALILGIYGSGGIGREAKEIAELLGLWKEIVFIDDMEDEGRFKGCKRMPFKNFCRIYPPSEAEVVIALGEPEYRINLYNRAKKAGYAFANLIHPAACVSPSSYMGKGNIIQAGVFISCDASIGNNIYIAPGASVGHDNIVGNSCVIAAGVALGGRCEVGEGVFIGQKVPVQQDVKIGNNTVVGMGSVVSRDIPDNVIALGVPARAMKHKDGSKVFK